MSMKGVSIDCWAQLVKALSHEMLCPCGAGRVGGPAALPAHTGLSDCHCSSLARQVLPNLPMSHSSRLLVQ